MDTQYIQDRAVRHTSYVRLPVTILYIAFTRRVARMDDFYGDLQEESLGRPSIKYQNSGYYYEPWISLATIRSHLTPIAERRRDQGQRKVTVLHVK